MRDVLTSVRYCSVHIYIHIIQNNCLHVSSFFPLIPYFHAHNVRPNFAQPFVSGVKSLNGVISRYSWSIIQSLAVNLSDKVADERRRGANQDKVSDFDLRLPILALCWSFGRSPTLVVFWFRHEDFFFSGWCASGSEDPDCCRTTVGLHFPGAR